METETGQEASAVFLKENDGDLDQGSAGEVGEKLVGFRSILELEAKDSGVWLGVG